MEFAFTEEQLLVQQTVRQFAKDKLLPNYSRWDRGEKIGRAEIREVPLEQRWRDVVGFEIGDGTPEVMKGIVAREAFGKAYTAYKE